MSPLDLHVLGTPPAFVLSQDQTLMFNPLTSFRTLNSLESSLSLRSLPLRSSLDSLRFRSRFLLSCAFLSVSFSRFGALTLPVLPSDSSPSGVSSSVPPPLGCSPSGASPQVRFPARRPFRTPSRASLHRITKILPFVKRFFKLFLKKLRFFNVSGRFCDTKTQLFVFFSPDCVHTVLLIQDGSIHF